MDKTWTLIIIQQYERKFIKQQQQLEDCLSQLRELTSDARAQRILDQQREIIRLQQTEAMQSDKHFVYDSIN